MEKTSKASATIQPAAGRTIRRVVLVGLTVLPIVCPIAAQAQAIEGVTAIVTRLRSLGRLDKAGVERFAGRALQRADSGGNPYFASWRAGGASFGPIVVSNISLREPVAGSPATAGAILVLTIGGGCARRAEVESRFGPLSQVGVPRGRSRDEETSLARQEPLGRLTFGFAERNPDCLRSIGLATPRP